MTVKGTEDPWPLQLSRAAGVPVGTPEDIGGRTVQVSHLGHLVKEVPENVVAREIRYSARRIRSVGSRRPNFRSAPLPVSIVPNGTIEVELPTLASCPKWGNWRITGRIRWLPSRTGAVAPTAPFGAVVIRTSTRPRRRGELKPKTPAETPSGVPVGTPEPGTQEILPRP